MPLSLIKGGQLYSIPDKIVLSAAVLFELTSAYRYIILML